VTKKLIVDALSFLFSLITKSIVIAKDRGLGPEMGVLFRKWLSCAPKARSNQALGQQIDSAFGAFLASLVGIGFQ